MAILQIRDPSTGRIQDVPVIRGDYGTKLIFGSVEYDDTSSKYFITPDSIDDTNLRSFDFIINSTDYSLWRIIDISTKEVESTGHYWQGPIGPTGAQGVPGLPFQIYKIYTSFEEMEEDFENVDEGLFVVIECQDEECLHEKIPVDKNDDDVTDTYDPPECHHGSLFLRGATHFIYVTTLQDFRAMRGLPGLGWHLGKIIKDVDNNDIYDVTSILLPLGRSVMEGDLILDEDGYVWRVKGGPNPLQVEKANIQIKGPQGIQGIQGERGLQGPTGATGRGIVSVTLKEKVGRAATYVITFTSGTSTEFTVFDGEPGETGPAGPAGPKGVGIFTISLDKTEGLVDTYKIHYTNGNFHEFTVTNGNGIESITKTATEGLADTYTITLSNGETETFTVTNGEKGDTGNGIKSITVDSVDGLTTKYKITFTDDSVEPFFYEVKDGADAVSIESVELNESNELIIHFTDSTSTNLGNIKGQDGANGKSAYEIAKETGAIEESMTEAEWAESLKPNSIVSVEGPETNGLVDTYQINFTKSEPTTFTVTNGKDGIDGKDYVLTTEDIQEIREGLSSLRVELTTAEELPTKTETNVIYMVPVGEGETPDHYLEYLVYNGKPELIGSTAIPLEDYATLRYVQEEPKLYKHSIIMRMADTNGYTEEDNSICGAFMISFDLINNDPEPYTFNHTAKASGSQTPTAMYPLDAWQLLRLYRALSTSVILPPPPTPKAGEEYSYHSLIAMGMLVDRRPCSGSIIGAKGVGRGSVNTIWAGYNKYNELKSGNQVIPNTAERVICITGELFVANADFDDLVVKITCGRANVSEPIDGEDLQETSLWESFEEFTTKEYKVRRAETGSDLGDNYFFTRRLYCKDLVEDLNPYAPMSIIRPTEKDLVITINDTAYTYKVRKGMTWDHWVKSDYNTDGYTIGGSGDGYISVPESLYGKTGGRLYLEGEQVSPVDFIDESQNYKA